LGSKQYQFLNQQTAAPSKNVGLESVEMSRAMAVSVPESSAPAFPFSTSFSGVSLYAAWEVLPTKAKTKNGSTSNRQGKNTEIVRTSIQTYQGVQDYSLVQVPPWQIREEQKKRFCVDQKSDSK
jgi:hypothetical protein